MNGLLVVAYTIATTVLLLVSSNNMPMMLGWLAIYFLILWVFAEDEIEPRKP